MMCICAPESRLIKGHVAMPLRPSKLNMRRSNNILYCDKLASSVAYRRRIGGGGGGGGGLTPTKVKLSDVIESHFFS